MLTVRPVWVSIRLIGPFMQVVLCNGCKFTSNSERTSPVLQSFNRCSDLSDSR
jgi:hypothetical protein